MNSYKNIVCNIWPLLKRMSKVVLAFVGNDATAVHLHNGTRARHQEQCGFQKDFRTATKPLLPSIEVHTNTYKKFEFQYKSSLFLVVGMQL